MLGDESTKVWATRSLTVFGLKVDGVVGNRSLGSIRPDHRSHLQDGFLAIAR